MSYTMLRVMDLFSGIGGFSLGLKKAGGFRTVAYCEIDPYCQRVLEQRMRDGALDTAPICTDVRRLDGWPWRGRVDVICGSFPCQDISEAGKRAGITGERSGLWKEIARLVRQIGPRFVIVENVSALLVRGMGTVLGDLAEVGYDAEWEIISAASVGAPHLRERVWIVAYPKGYLRRASGDAGSEASDGRREALADSQGEQDRGRQLAGVQSDPGAGGEMAHTFSIYGGRNLRERFLEASRSSWWDVEPAVGRVADGVPDRVDRLKSLGNSIVPYIVELIGRRIKGCA